MSKNNSRDSGNVLLSIIIIAFIFTVGIIIINILNNIGKQKMYEETEGIVIDYITEEDRRDHKNVYREVYQYTVNNKKYKIVSNNLYHTKPIEKKTSIIQYNPSNPEESIIKTELNISIIIFGAFIFVAVIIIGVIMSIKRGGKPNLIIWIMNLLCLGVGCIFTFKYPNFQIEVKQLMIIILVFSIVVTIFYKKYLIKYKQQLERDSDIKRTDAEIDKMVQQGKIGVIILLIVNYIFCFYGAYKIYTEGTFIISGLAIGILGIIIGMIMTYNTIKEKRKNY